MAAPTSYARSFGFANYAAGAPTRPLPGIRVDAEFDNIAASTSSLALAINDVRGTDGRLKNGIVGYDALAPGLAEDLAADVGFKDYAALAASTRTFDTGTVVAVDGHRYEARPLATADGDIYSTTNAFYLLPAGNTFDLDGLGNDFGINNSDWHARTTTLFNRVKNRNILRLLLPSARLRMDHRLALECPVGMMRLDIVGRGTEFHFKSPTAGDGGIDISFLQAGCVVNVSDVNILSHITYAQGGARTLSEFGRGYLVETANHGIALTIRNSSGGQNINSTQAMACRVKIDCYDIAGGIGLWSGGILMAGVFRPIVHECVVRSRTSWWDKSTPEATQDFYGRAGIHFQDTYAHIATSNKVAGPFVYSTLMESTKPRGGGFGMEGGFLVDNEQAGIAICAVGQIFNDPEYLADDPASGDYLVTEPGLHIIGGHAKGYLHSVYARNMAQVRITDLDTVGASTLADMATWSNQTVIDLDRCVDVHLTNITNETHGYHNSDSDCSRTMRFGPGCRDVWVTGCNFATRGIAIVTEMLTDSLFISNSPFGGIQYSDYRVDRKPAINIASTNGCRPLIDGVRKATGTLTLELGGVDTDATFTSDITVFHHGTSIYGDATFEIQTANTVVGALVVKSDLLPSPLTAPDGSAWVTDYFGVPEAIGSQFGAVVSQYGIQLRAPVLGVSATPRYSMVRMDEAVLVAGARFRIAFHYDCGEMPSGNWVSQT